MKYIVMYKWYNVLIAFINKLISILFKKMMSYSNSFKPKPKNPSDLPNQYLTVYPPDNNRKSITNNNQPPKVPAS
jgi:hypothetical protein